MKDKYNALLKKFEILEDDRYTRPVLQKVKYEKLKGMIPPIEDYNFQADLLMMPETKKKNKYILVVVDLWSDEIDCRPLKSKTQLEVLTALKDIFKGKYLKKPYATIRTDNGLEFKGAVQNYFYNESILHTTSLPHRHRQLGSVENVNKLLGRFLNNYMNMKENKTGKVYKDWDDILDELVKDLNAIRKIPDQNPYSYEYAPVIDETPKYKVGDVVYRKLDAPKNALNNEEYGKFRVGDYRWDVKEPKKIINVYYYPKNVRYKLEGINNATYTKEELLPANEKESKWAVRAIIDGRTIKKKKEYLIWFKGYLKKDAIWLSEKSLREDGLGDMIDAYDKSQMVLTKY